MGTCVKKPTWLVHQARIQRFGVENRRVRAPFSCRQFGMTRRRPRAAVFNALALQARFFQG